MIGASCDEADAEKLQYNLTRGTRTAWKSWADEDFNLELPPEIMTSEGNC